MMGANGAVLFSLLIYAALLYGAVRLIKYFIRYGIDYYFEKLAEYQKNQKHTGGLKSYEPDHHPVRHRERCML